MDCYFRKEKILEPVGKVDSEYELNFELNFIVLHLSQDILYKGYHIHLYIFTY